MNSETLFNLSLNSQPPWEVKEVKSVHNESKLKELHLQIGFAVSARFADEAGNLCSVNDTVEQTWQHLSFLSTLVTCYARHAIHRIKTSLGNVVYLAAP